MASRHNIESLTVVPKLKYEHVFLTSFSKMRVDLAAQVCNCILYVLLHLYSVMCTQHFILTQQVMSGTVAHAISYRMKDALDCKKPSMECTARFVQMIDKMFDCLNVGNFTDGKHTRNCFKQPYRAQSDFCLKVYYPSMYI